MPISNFFRISHNAAWCIWEITETVDDLRKKVVLAPEDLGELGNIHHPVKLKESLASRACVQELVRRQGKEYFGIYKDEHRKPYLIRHPLHISIAHSHPFAVAILHKILPVGIDVEKPEERLLRLAPRFLSGAELADGKSDVKKLCVYWAGKEAVYKLNGRKELSFRSDIRIYPFQLQKRDVIRCEFLAKGNPVKLALVYREFKGHLISYCF
jgi:4'-phosphopantetheinyl transferase